jgi:hypothetical protein
MVAAVLLLGSLPAAAEGTWWSGWIWGQDGAYTMFQVQWLDDFGTSTPSSVEAIGRVYWRARTKNGAATWVQLSSIGRYYSCGSGAAIQTSPSSAQVTNANDDPDWYNYVFSMTRYGYDRPAVKYTWQINFQGDVFAYARKIWVNDTQWGYC